MANSTAKVQAIQGASRAIIGANLVKADTPLSMILANIIDATAGEPNFPPAQEPKANGRAYKAHDGTQFYRLEARVATRAGQFGGPDIRFLKDIDGTIRLHVELEQQFPAGVPQTATPLGKISGTPRIVWAGGEVALGKPTIFRDAESGQWRMRFLQDLAASDVSGLFDAMTDRTASAKLELNFEYPYTISTDAAPDQGGGNSVGDQVKDAIKKGLFDIFRRGIQGRFESTEATIASPRLMLNRMPMATVRRLEPIKPADSRVRVNPQSGIKLDPKIIDAITKRPPIIDGPIRIPRPNPQPRD